MCCIRRPWAMTHEIQMQLQKAAMQQQQQMAVTMLVQVLCRPKQQMQSKQSPCWKISRLQQQQQQAP
jgi:hypothetical protein